MTTPSGMNQQAVVRGIELRLDTVLQGLLAAIPAGVTTISVGNRQMPIADAIKLVQSHVQPYKDSRAARATLRQLSVGKKDRSKSDRSLLADLKAGCVVIFGRESEDLTKFGFKPVKPLPEPTVEEKARRVAKAKVTREKRHTMGSKQKAELKATETPEISIPAHGPMEIIDSSNGTGSNGSSPAAPTNGAKPSTNAGRTAV